MFFYPIIISINPQANQEKEEISPQLQVNPSIQITNSFAHMKQYDHFFLLLLPINQNPPTYPFPEKTVFYPIIISKFHGNEKEMESSKKIRKWKIYIYSEKGVVEKSTRCRCRLPQQVAKQRRPSIRSRRRNRWCASWDFKGVEFGDRIRGRWVKWTRRTSIPSESEDPTHFH